MLKKYKQLIIGIIIGSILSCSVAFANDIRTFIAQEAQFPVVVNGTAVKLDMPVVTIDGRTYMPLRAMGDVLGVKVNWNDEKKQAEITKEGNVSNPSDNVNGDLPRFEDGSNIYYDENGVKYFNCDYSNSFLKNIYVRPVLNNKIEIDRVRIVKRENSDEVVLDNVEYKIINSIAFISEDYFNTTILPLDKWFDIVFGQRRVG